MGSGRGGEGQWLAAVEQSWDPPSPDQQSRGEHGDAGGAAGPEAEHVGGHVAPPEESGEVVLDHLSERDQQWPRSAGDTQEPQHVALGRQPRVDARPPQQDSHARRVDSGGPDGTDADVHPGRVRGDPDDLGQHVGQQQDRDVAQPEDEQQRERQPGRRIPERHLLAGLEHRGHSRQSEPEPEVDRRHEADVPPPVDCTAELVDEHAHTLPAGVGSVRRLTRSVDQTARVSAGRAMAFRVRTSRAIRSGWSGGLMA